MKNKVLLVLVLAIVLLSGCGSDESKYKNISPSDAKQKLEMDSSIVLIDVRTQMEHEEGHIKGSLLLPLDSLGSQISYIVSDKETTIIVYCKGGNRSKTAAQLLTDLGYSSVYDLGGIDSWPYGLE